MLENVQKGLCMPLFEYSGRVYNKNTTRKINY